MGCDPAGPCDEDPDPTTDDPVTRRVHAALDRLAGDMSRLGIALSGGGDSTALLHLAQSWARGRSLMAATIDHGLRPESTAEAAGAGRAAAALGIDHATLSWQRGPASGNLMAAARDARLRLLSDWATQNRLDAVLLGHTLDDQAETVLMRLARGAGVDGLAGMSASRRANGTVWLRPMLAVSRAELRDWLTARGIGWVDDPSNENADYDRVRIRKAVEALGLPAAQIAQSAANLASARDALQDVAAAAASGAEIRNGSLYLPWTPFRRAPQEVRRRLIVAGLRLVGGADYPPRREAVLRALTAILTGARATLEGAIAEPAGDWLRIMREPVAAARGAPGVPDAQGECRWDGRWLLSGLCADQQVRALGYDPLPGLKWRLSGLARDEAAASPGIWKGAQLIAAPLLESRAEMTARPLAGVPEFMALLYTH
ncbi:tRNA lysidine(34) synthetase TilS [Paracoccus sp. NGMCC 1.201697]|uniref:tRNA(Ile)-lysidine synthase n=1 Tax=Paracoccus broussonetiae subsp. drimophilus TaxID=3373869 RepID=A0ABW7LGG5_9RHOB